MKNWRIPRRTFLKGLGTAMALPLLEAMQPAALAAATAGAKSAPRRMAFVYVPNGAHMADWRPKNFGVNYDLPPILAPLEKVRDEVCVFTGLTHDKGRAHG